MGTGLTAVADAGPLMHLSEIGVLRALSVFSLVHIPDTAWAEATGTGRADPSGIEAAVPTRRHALVEQTIREFVAANSLAGLHRGEIECLCLCRQLSASVLLTDDLAAREAAARLAIRPVGSLGVIVRAFRSGLMSLADAEACIEKLYSVSSLFVTRSIVDLAIEQLRSA